MFAPEPKQRDAMINFGALPQPSAAFIAAPCLQAPQKSRVISRRIPKSPCDQTCAVPDRILVGPCFPQIDMPAEAINRLPAHTAKARSQRIGAFPIRRGRRPECRWQPDLAVVAEPPAPAAGRFAAASERTRQAITRSGCAPQYESIASGGVGGTNGRPSARDRTADMERCAAMPWWGELATADFFPLSLLPIWT